MPPVCSPATGWTETDRLAALLRYGIIDTPKEAEFEDIVRLASDVFDAPIAVVNLIASDRQWFKAEVGIGARELPLDVSICAHAILQDDLFIVPDTLLDDRFRNNPLVNVEGGLRFYAGALLKTEEGLPLGTVCVLDRAPRPDGVTERQRLTLEVLARQVMTQLDLRRAIVQRDERSMVLEAENARRIAAEEARSQSETRYLDLFSAIDAGLCVFEMRYDEHGRGADYRFLEVNRAFATHTGLENAQGRWIRDMVPSHDQYWFDVYGDVARTGQSVRVQNLATGLGNRWFDVHAFRIGKPEDRQVAALFTDITARRKSEQELHELNQTLEERVTEVVAEREATAEALRQSQKMEAIGQLTGGLAHDFNNMLTGVIGSLDLIRRFLDSGKTQQVWRYLDAAETSAQRAAALTARLLAFGRRQSLDIRPTDVNQLVCGMEDLLRRTLGEQVDMAIELAKPLRPASTDANQLESALLNLCINARDAMPDGGHLTIETTTMQLDKGFSDTGEDLQPGDYVVLSVSDDGQGMSEETMTKVFEPFFTTKPIGQGTGLGLSMIYGFLKQSGGHVRLYSVLGKGTSVKLFLPCSDAPIAPAEPRAAAMPAGTGETVLVVEDDAAVRMVIVNVLDELGYAACEADDADGALSILQSDRKIDLLISDVGLPGLNGRQLAEIARQDRPGLKVLFVTGYAQGAAVRSGFLDHGMDMLTKPFQIDTLAIKVRQMLTLS
ncbi:ATP-binding protein [Blastomonas sp.]|uniref:ATP-binding protein n=1 Tax=Blastomonas sp. TaxID=1909299 RepID=UPI002615978C|nr:ATP-binding protein [Blastomonas sp.]MDM7956792.1 response regulator [Blastomonas sp.]